MHMTTRLSGLLLLALATFVPHAAAAAPAWKLVSEAPITHKASVAAFLDEKNGITGGYAGAMYVTQDGGKTWSPGTNSSACRFGLEARPGAAFTAGNHGHVRASKDGGAHWTSAASFGRQLPGHARFLSFVDAKRGVVASPSDLGLTADGGESWTKFDPPPEASAIAAVSLAEEGGALRLRVLDETGDLWLSLDGAKTWAQAPSPLRDPVMASMTTPWAALRFNGPEGVLAAFLDEGLPKGHVYRTRDGGKTWAEDPVDKLAIGSPNLSWDAKVLVTFDAQTLHVYHAQ
jgi:photosystem II stability/assembly factor-like uncharacterized protein